MNKMIIQEIKNILELRKYIYYENENGVLYNGDCLEIMKLLPNDCVDLVLTSPPYNKGATGKSTKNRWELKKYDGYNDNMPYLDYKKWQENVLKMCLSILNNNGSFLYNNKNIMKENRIFTPYEIIIEGNLLNNLKQEIIWNRKSGVQNNIYQYYPVKTEKIFWFVKTNSYYLNCKNYDEIINISFEINTEHPAPFPLKLASVMVNNHSQENDIVLDCFGGSGTTAVACEKLNRKWILIEQSREYCEMAKQRIEAEYNQIKMF